MTLAERLFRRKPTRDQFADLVIKALAQIGFRDVAYQPAEFILRTGRRDDVIFLDNGYANYCKAEGREREAILQRLCSAWGSHTEIPADFEAARRFLMPVIRDASYASIVKLDLISKKVDVSKVDCPTIPLCGPLVVGLAYDTEHSIQQVNMTSFERWGVAFEDVLKEALHNLRDKTDPGGMTEEAPGLFRSRWGDSYDSARLLLTDLIYRIPVHGERIGFVPNRDQLWVTGDRDNSALQTLLKIGEEAHFAPYPISPDLFILTDGNLQVYRPEDRFVLDSLLSLKRRRKALDYLQQKEALDAINVARGVDIFVASYLVFEREDGSQYSACVWSKGVDSLLPKADQLFFLLDKDTKDYIPVQWERAFSIVRELMQEDDGIVPERYRVRLFPSEDQLAQLRNAS